MYHSKWHKWQLGGKHRVFWLNDWRKKRGIKRLERINKMYFINFVVLRLKIMPHTHNNEKIKTPHPEKKWCPTSVSIQINCEK